MGVKAHTTMIRGLYTRADIPDSFVPYDLRDTFATMVLKYSRDWFLTERLLHHKLPGEGKRYAGYPMSQLCEDLQQFSPLRRIKIEPTVLTRKGGQDLSVNGEGGTRTPTPFGHMILSHARLPVPTLPHKVELALDSQHEEVNKFYTTTIPCFK